MHVYNNRILIIALAAQYLFSPAVRTETKADPAKTPDIENKAPEFNIQSGEGQLLNLDMIKGKITLLFYETREVVEKNRQLKNELNRLHEEKNDGIKERIVRLPVINCSGVIWPFTRIWRNQLAKHSKKEGITIYGDWDGRMFEDYRMKDEESNILIIDQNGIIRFRASGKIGQSETENIKRILTTLLDAGDSASQ